MARKRLSTAKAYRNLARIEDKAQQRCHDIAQFVVEHISTFGPYDENRPDSHTGPHLKDSYYARFSPEQDAWMIRCRRRYWVYVEFGTRRSKANPHVRPALDAARVAFKGGPPSAAFRGVTGLPAVPRGESELR